MSELLTTYTQKALSSFYDWVWPDTPGADMKLIDQALRAAARDYCMWSRQWRLTLDALSVEANEPAIEIDVPDDAVLWELRKVKLSKEPLDPTTEAAEEGLNRDWDTLKGTPERFLLLDDSVLRLVPIPSVTVSAGLYLEGYLMPTQTAAKLPSFLLNNVETLAKGAKAYLMAMQKKPWSNAVLAATLEQEFRLDVSRTGLRGAKGFTRAALRTSVVHR